MTIDVGVGLEPIHLHQDLVKGLLPLIVASAKSGAAVASHRVDLVDKHDARGVALGLLEQVADPGCANANEHFHELAAADVEEGHSCLPRHGAGKQGLASTGLANQQYALGNSGAKGKEAFRVLEELHHFLEFRLRLLNPRNIGEAYAGTVEGHHASAAAPEAQGLVVAALGLAHHE